MNRMWGRLGLGVAMAAAVATVVATGIAFLPMPPQAGPAVVELDATTTTTPPPEETVATSSPVTVDTSVPLQDECPPQLSVDVDGDGAPDAASLQAAIDVTMVVCAASGVRYETPVAGMGEIFAAHDFGGDGLVELMPGGTSVLAAFYDVHAFDPGAGEVVPVIREDGSPLLLVDGWDDGAGHRFGCPQEALDQVRVLTVDFGADEAAWSVETISITGTTASVVATEAGTVDVVPPAGQELEALADARFTSLVGECEFVYAS